MVGRVMGELIEPLDDKSMFGRFLAAKGEGRCDEALTRAKGRELPLSGT